jgi:TniQ
MARILPPVLNRLPRTVKPFPAETTASYLARLAHANRLDAEALRHYITGRRHRTPPFPADRLAIVTGYPVRALRYAIPDLSFGYGPLDSDHYNNAGFPQHKTDDGPACNRCALARGITMPVRCWKRPENVICLRHRRWIGPGAETGQPGLSAQPAILQAHKRHLRLVRRFGRDQVATGFAVADHICRRWHEHRRHDAGFCDRMLAFHGPRWQAPPASPTVAAAIYPQAVALTRLLVSPYWQALSSGHRGRQELFIAEVRRTVAPGYLWPQPYRPADPLGSWITEHHLPSGYRPALFRYHSWPLAGPARS